jgi:hypothetical protein
MTEAQETLWRNTYVDQIRRLSLEVLRLRAAVQKLEMVREKKKNTSAKKKCFNRETKNK